MSEEKQAPPEFYYSSHDYGKTMRLVMPPESTHFARHLEEIHPGIPELHEYNYELIDYEEHYAWGKGRQGPPYAPCWIYQLINERKPR